MTYRQAIPARLAMSDRFAEAVAAVLLLAALLFGGGPRGMGDLVVHLCAVPALALALLRWRGAQATPLQRLFAWGWLAAVGVVALQLLPLPASWFASLPQRASVLADLRSAGLDPAWLPMTLDRYGTLRALLALLGFGAMALLVTTLGANAHRRLLLLALAVGVALALLGFSQAAAGAHGLRFFDYHHPIGAIGSFANRNHFATLLAMLAPIALVFAAQAQARRQLGATVAAFGVAAILLLAAALSFSRAGFALAVLASGLAMLILFTGRGARGRWQVPLALVAVTTVAVLVYASAGLALRLEQDPLDDLRWQYLRHGVDTASAYLPWGSGAGSFPWAYAPIEPVRAMVQVYADRAHNDYLQVAIELGVPGVLLMFGFAVLFVSAVTRIILIHHKALMADHSASCVMAVSVLVPLLHSLVDYPLRTLAVAMLSGLMLSLFLGDGFPPGGRRHD